MLRPEQYLAIGLGTCLLVAGCSTLEPGRSAPPTPVARAPATAPPPLPVPATPAPVPRAGNPPFYEVYGERYFVMPSSEGYRQTGIASWYGQAFHGKRTSSGTIYNMYEFSAAHKTLPLPSLVRVTNLSNGKSVVVTVDDRGPFVKNRLIDLSYAAAKELDIVRSGTAEVEVEALGGASGAGPVIVYSPGSGPSAPAATGGSIAPALVPAQHLYMQVGAFGSRANAERLKTHLESNGVSKVVIRYDASAGKTLYRVRIGPLSGADEYDALATRIAPLHSGSPSLVTESPTAGDSLSGG
jgi:rare lipoprotein A